MRTRKLTSGAWKFVDRVYRTNHVLVCCEPPEITKRLTRILGTEHAKVIVEAGMGDTTGVGGRMVGTRHEQYGQTASIYIRPSADVGVIVHEAMHAIYYVLDAKGLTLSLTSEEAFTYYLEWLVREITVRVLS